MALLIDQDNAATTFGWVAGGDGTSIRRVGQSFQLDSDSTITSIKFRAGLATGSSFTITARIETNNAGNPSGTLADANLTGTVAGTGSAGSNLHEVTFATPAILLAATSYWLVIQKTTEGTANNYYTIWGSNTSTYASGNNSVYNTGAWSTGGGASDCDSYFQILGSVYVPAQTTVGHAYFM